ncbi:MAG TPA: hypothetical protein VEA41_13340 [Salinarimonas sp.]|nr:hypothetical protein [Salinarimonas sp.]
MEALVLRIDVGPRIGLGHMRRATALAEEARSLGLATLFACSAQARPILEREGVSPDALIEPDAIEAAGPRATVLVDTLWSGNGAATALEVERLVAAGLTVAVLDSLPRDHYEVPPAGRGADLVVTPYLAAERFRSAPRAGRWLTGPAFCVLDPAFARARAGMGRRAGDRILFSCGGSDPEGTTAAFLDRLGRDTRPVDVVIGPLFAGPLRARIEAAAATRPAVTLHHAPTTLASLMAGAGLVAGRAGLQRYEAAALGRTGVYLHHGDSFHGYFEAFASSGLARIHFAARPGGVEGFLDDLARIARPGAHLPELAFNEAAFAAVDGGGARRLIEAFWAVSRS